MQVLGHSHALSGLAAGAATLPWAPVHGTVSQFAWVAAAGGFAMVPDLDASGSTVSDMWGPITEIPSGAVGRLAQGHRWGTHDVVLGPLVFGALAIAAAGNDELPLLAALSRQWRAAVDAGHGREDVSAARLALGGR